MVGPGPRPRAEHRRACRGGRVPPRNGSTGPAVLQPTGGVVAAPGHEVLSRPLAVVAGPARRRRAARTSPRSAKEPVGTADGSVGRLRGSRTRLTLEKLAVTSSSGDLRHPDRHRRRGTAHRGPRGAREPGGVAGRGVGHRRHCARDDSGDWGRRTGEGSGRLCGCASQRHPRWPRRTTSAKDRSGLERR
jgi:hypothetical protein